MEEVSQSDGRTILFVSHNMSYISSLCNKAVLLDKGTIVQTGAVNEVVNGYMNMVKQTSFDSPVSGNKNIARLLSVKTVDADGLPKDNFGVNDTTGIKMDYEAFKWVNGKWQHIDKFFHEKLEDGQAPVPNPIRDVKGNTNQEKLKQQSEKNRGKSRDNDDL